MLATIRIRKVTIRFPVGVPDDVDESAVYCPHHERIVRTGIVTKRFRDAEFHFRMRLAICYPY